MKFTIFLLLISGTLGFPNDNVSEDAIAVWECNDVSAINNSFIAKFLRVLFKKKKSFSHTYENAIQMI